MLLARWYFAIQAVAGALWWCAVFLSDDVRRWTLGDLSPEVLVVPDLLLFVGASSLAAIRGGRGWAVVAASWTTVVAAALAVHATVERGAGWGAVLMIVASVCSVGASLTLWFGRLPTQWFFVGPFAFVPSPEASPARHVRRSLTQLVVFWGTFLIALPLLLGWVERRWRLGWPPVQDPAMVARRHCGVLGRQRVRPVGVLRDGATRRGHTVARSHRTTVGRGRPVSCCAEPDGGGRRCPDGGCRSVAGLMDGDGVGAGRSGRVGCLHQAARGSRSCPPIRVRVRGVRRLGEVLVPFGAVSTSTLRRRPFDVEHSQ